MNSASAKQLVLKTLLQLDGDDLFEVADVAHKAAEAERQARRAVTGNENVQKAIAGKENDLPLALAELDFQVVKMGSGKVKYVHKDSWAIISLPTAGRHVKIAAIARKPEQWCGRNGPLSERLDLHAWDSEEAGYDDRSPGTLHGAYFSLPILDCERRGTDFGYTHMGSDSSYSMTLLHDALPGVNAGTEEGEDGMEDLARAFIGLLFSAFGCNVVNRYLKMWREEGQAERAHKERRGW